MLRYSSPPVNATTYDLLPYEDYCFAATHPEHLFTVSRLFGHRAPDFGTSRVLELGCARGGNLLPMALDLPDATFVGIDLSARQIDEGLAQLRRIGVRNITLETRSIMDLDASFGAFDYVICHGVYSWVPEPVRDAILARCRDLLTPAGVAYVSYNTLPGWDIGRSLRDFLLMNLAATANVKEKVARAREALRALIVGLKSQPGAHAAAFRVEAESLLDVPDSYLFHEYLETSNDPVYFREFVERARAFGLDHLADADLRSAIPESTIELEQSVDFIRGRRFRASLLVRTAPRERIAMDIAQLAHCHVSTRLELAEDSTEDALRADSPLRFTHDGKPLQVTSAMSKCALATLIETQRRPIAYVEWCARIARRLGLSDPRSVAARLITEADVRGWIAAGFLDLHAGPARFADDASLRPLACPLARDQATYGTRVSNRRHVQLDLDAFEHTLLPLLDGTHDRAALRTALQTRSGAMSEGALAGRIEEALEWLALNALLIA